MGAIVEKTADQALATANEQTALFLRRRPLRSRFAGNQEPALAELLADPMLHRLLASDGVMPDHLIDLLADVKVRLARRGRAL
jgi:hypothetical protein